VKIIEIQAPALFEFASAKMAGHFRHEAGHRLLTLMAEDGIAAQAVFTSVAPTMKAEVHVWTDGKHGLACFSLLARVIRYAFDELQCVRLQTVARASNLRAHSAIVRAGFEFEAPMKCWYGTEDGWMFRMLRHDCRWLKGRT
jgi:hypothetical protein